MDRLTISGFDYDRDFIASHLQSWSIAQAVKRLAAYEDTGFTPAEIVAFKAKLGEFSEAFKGAQAVCEVATSEKMKALVERDRLKARAEEDIRKAIFEGVSKCSRCAYLAKCDPDFDCEYDEPKAPNQYEWEWRGPQEGANP